MEIAGLVVGALLLVFGRRLFWLFIAVIGFFAGMTLAGRFFPDNTSLQLAAGAVVGLVGAGLAVFLQRVAILVGGFLAGGYLMVTLIGMFLNTQGGVYWLPFLIGGILGALLLSLVFDWALVILSSLTGAVMIVRYLPVQAPISMFIVAALFIIGMVVQARVRIFG